MDDPIETKINPSNFAKTLAWLTHFWSMFYFYNHWKHFQELYKQNIGLK